MYFAGGRLAPLRTAPGQRPDCPDSLAGTDDEKAGEGGLAAGVSPRFGRHVPTEDLPHFRATASIIILSRLGTPFFDGD
jgi:hypothetical protein